MMCASSRIPVSASQSSGCRLLHLSSPDHRRMRAVMRKEILRVEEWSRQRRRKIKSRMIKWMGQKEKPDNIWIVGDQARVNNQSGRLKGFDVTGMPVSVCTRLSTYTVLYMSYSLTRTLCVFCRMYIRSSTVAYAIDTLVWSLMRLNSIPQQ